jgi:Spy/CpxP family protein refolding chaperone
MDRTLMLLGLAIALAAPLRAQEGAGPGPEASGERRGLERMQRRGMPPPGGGETGIEGQGIVQELLNDAEVAAKAGISADQVATLRSGFEELKKDIEKLKKDLETASLEQAGILSKASVDEEALMKAVEQTGAVRTEMAKVSMKGLLLVKRTLSPEQIEKVKVLVRETARERMRDRMREWRERGGWDRRPGGGAPPSGQAPSNPDAIL